MSSVWNVTKKYLNLFVLRGKPSDTPYSVILLLSLSLVFIFTKTLTYMWFIHVVDKFDPKDTMQITYFGAAIVSGIWVMILFATLRSTLLYYHIIERFVQTATCLLAIDCLLNVLYLGWLGMLAYFEIPAAGTPSFAAFAIIIAFLLLMYWQFMAYIHILIYSMNLTVLKAAVFTLFYMLLQHNLSEVLLNSVTTITHL